MITIKKTITRLSAPILWTVLSSALLLGGAAVVSAQSSETRNVQKETGMPSKQPDKSRDGKGLSGQRPTAEGKDNSIKQQREQAERHKDQATGK
jgi:hypothetical protein